MKKTAKGGNHFESGGNQEWDRKIFLLSPSPNPHPFGVKPVALFAVQLDLRRLKEMNRFFSYYANDLHTRANLWLPVKNFMHYSMHEACVAVWLFRLSSWDEISQISHVVIWNDSVRNFLHIYMYFSFCQQAIEAPCLIPSVIFCKRRSCEDFLCQIFDHWFRNVFVTCSSCLTCEQVLIYMQTTGD